MDEDLHYDEMTMEQLQSSLSVLNSKRGHLLNEIGRRLKAGQKQAGYKIGPVRTKPKPSISSNPLEEELKKAYEVIAEIESRMVEAQKKGEKFKCYNIGAKRDYSSKKS